MTHAAPYIRARTSSRCAIAIWLFVVAALIFAMVVIGGITRLTESGLSITEWKPVTGTLPPLSEAEWQAEFEKYRQIPEYREKNLGMSLTEYKAIYWWEYLHRLWGRLIGAAFLLPFLWFLLRGHILSGLAWKLGVVFLLGAAQGALGWYMVASGLVDRISVSPYRLTAHLALALLIFAAVLWIALDLVRPNTRGIDGRALALSCLVLLTIASGGFVAGHDAGMIYNTFPLMDGSLIPPGYLDLEPWWRNGFENPAAVQFNHRVLGMATALLSLLYWRAARNDATGAAYAVLVVALLQASLGIGTLLLEVPVGLAALHQTGAVALLTASLVAAQGGR
ncbi:MAG: heme A synthase [Alphaproteobacteria bacterium]|nr:heme A synthase [Alphaproteobacteria bacterium]